ncbi:MAG: 16S rRNA (guanine(966)-N(2))-methyltransferase RsmD [Candidatus Rhabdochlamydia sp.]
MTLKIIGGTFKGRKLKAPGGSQTRPTMSMVRKAVFDMLCQEIEGARFLDIFAGSGGMGMEALSRGASHAIFIDSHPEAIAVLKHNLEMLGVSIKSTLCTQDVMKSLLFLEKRQTICDVIYVDPPYAQTHLYNTLLTYLDTTALLSSAGSVFIETPSSNPLDFSHQTLMHLKHVLTRQYGSTLIYRFIKQ